MLRFSLSRFRAGRSVVRIVLSAVFALALLGSRATAAARPVPPAPLSSLATVTVNDVGDATWNVDFIFSPAAYPQAKAALQKEADAFGRRYFDLFLPEWAPGRGAVPTTLNETLHTIGGTWTTPGLASPRKDGTWVLPIHTVGEPKSFVTTRGIFLTTLFGWGPVTFSDDHAALATDTEQHLHSAVLDIRLPNDSRDVRLLQSPLRVSYRPRAYSAPSATLADIPGSGGSHFAGLGVSAADFDVWTRPYVIPALAKLHADPRFTDMTVAHSAFKNTSGDLLRNYRVRFRLGDYTNPQWSPWQEVAEVRPGQTIVDLYYPLLDVERLAGVTSPTAVDVEAEYEYDRAGQHITGHGAQRTQLLGFDEVLYSYLPIREQLTFQEHFDLVPAVLAAYTTENDPLIDQLAAWANRRAGGVPAHDNDSEALKFLEQWYNLLADNGLVYQASLSVFVPDNAGQRIRFPREVLRDRTGTCIEEALLFASGCRAMGLRTIVTVVPGHCFPVVVLPSGTLVGIESTMIGRYTFQKAVDTGTKEYYMHKARGQLIAADIVNLRFNGYYSANLPKPTQSLKDWGWQELPAAPVAAGTLTGTWKADILNKKDKKDVKVTDLLIAVDVKFPEREVRFNADGTVLFIYRGLDGKEQTSKGKYTLRKEDGKDYLTITLDANQPEKGPFTGEVTWVKDGGFRWISPGGWSGSGFTLTFRKV